MSADLWRSDFGDRYHERNADAGRKRWPFWRDFYTRWPVASVLEVGCGNGANLKWAVAPKVAGVDANVFAILLAKSAVPRALCVTGSATRLPFPERSYELVFTAGVLIHLDKEERGAAMDEIFRVSSRYILAMEYAAPHYEEVKYRGLSNALWRGPFGLSYELRFWMQLRNIGTGRLSKSDGFDDVTWWLMEKR